MRPEGGGQLCHLLPVIRGTTEWPWFHRMFLNNCDVVTQEGTGLKAVEENAGSPGDGQGPEGLGGAGALVRTRC